MLILGLETSCDETGVAVYDSERGLLAHRLYSQIAVHAEYGGVVPELASRDHVRKALPLINEALAEAGHCLYTRPRPCWRFISWRKPRAIACVGAEYPCGGCSSYGRSLISTDARR